VCQCFFFFFHKLVGVHYKIDSNHPQSFMNLLTGDNSQRDAANNMNIVPTPPNWQYHPQYPQQYPHMQYPQYPQQPPPNFPLQGHHVPSIPNFNYGSTPSPYQLPPPSNTTSSTPRPPPNPIHNEGVGATSKWTLEEDRGLVTSWINVSTNPLIGADQKKTGFWTKIASAYNQHAPDGAAKRSAKVCNARVGKISTMGTTNVKNSVMWERYVIAQEKKAEAAKVKAEAAKRAVELIDSHQYLQRMKYEDKILRMDIAKMCPEDQARYGPLQEEIRSRYRQTSPSSNASPSLD